MLCDILDYVLFIGIAISITTGTFVLSVIISYFISLVTCKIESNIYHDNFFDYILFVREMCLISDFITMIIWILISVVGYYIWTKKVDTD